MRQNEAADRKSPQHYRPGINMKYSGTGILEKFSGETLAVTYSIEFPGNGDIGVIAAQHPSTELASFCNQEVDLRLEHGRLLEVSITTDGHVMYNNGQAIGFE
jgi:hypothetical protein